METWSEQSERVYRRTTYPGDLMSNDQKIGSNRLGKGSKIFEFNSGQLNCLVKRLIDIDCSV